MVRREPGIHRSCIRNEITEDFIAGLKNLFQEHYINIPDDKVDVVEGLTEDIRKMEDRPSTNRLSAT